MSASEAKTADLRHIVRHDAVAALGHARDVGACPCRRHAHAEKADAERTRDFAHLRQMRHQLGMCLMHVFQRRAGQFELPAGLQRNRAAPGHVVESDDILALHDRLPAEQELHAVQQRADAARPLIGHGIVPVHREGEFLVLGADAPFRFWLAARFEPGDEFVAPLDRRHVDLVTGHVVVARGSGC
jgi:hypothetical protein